MAIPEGFAPLGEHRDFVGNVQIDIGSPETYMSSWGTISAFLNLYEQIPFSGDGIVNDLMQISEQYPMKKDGVFSQKGLVGKILWLKFENLVCR